MFNGMRYVYAVYKEKSFSKAAEKLYISQPALSAMIKKTEAKVGMPIFDRTTSPVSLTECGREYIKTAERMMDLEEEFAHYVGNLSDLKTGSLSVGGTYLFSAFVLPPVVKRFAGLYPHVQVSLFEGHTALLEEKMFAGELDLVVDNLLLDETIYKKYDFMEERLILAVPASFSSNQAVREYSLSAREIYEGRHLSPDFPGVPLRNFEQDPFILLRLHNDTRQRVEAICRRAGVKLNITMKLNQLLTTYHLAGYGMGAAFVSDTVVKSQPPNPEIRYYKIEDENTLRQVYLYHKRNRYLTRSMTEFMKLMIPGLAWDS